MESKLAFNSLVRQTNGQASNSVLMVSPVGFGFDLASAADNKFMNQAQFTEQQVLDEFARFVQILERAGINVIAVQPPAKDLPDAVFPNNWFSTHRGRTADESAIVVYYPMKVDARRRERNVALMESLRSSYPTDLHYEAKETAGLFLEGTGVLVLDRIARIAYANLSERCDESLVRDWCATLHFAPILFRATSSDGSPVYHTNVVLSIGTKVAVVCAEMIRDTAERKNVLENLGKTHEVVEISEVQVRGFCGNVLELYRPGHRSQDGDSDTASSSLIMAMSTTAYNTFTTEQKVILERHVGELVHSDITTIETVGGGSARCMLAELF